MPGEIPVNVPRLPQPNAMNQPRWSDLPAALSGLETTFAALQADLERARGEYALRRYEPVARLLDDIQQRLPASPDARVTRQSHDVAFIEASLEVLRGRLLSRRDAGRAVDCFKRAANLFDRNAAYIEEHPNAVRILTDYGIALYRVGWLSGERIDEAIQLLERVCKSGTAPAEALAYLGYAELTRDNLDAAQTWLKKGLESSPTDPTMLYWLARVLEMSKQPTAAGAYCAAGEAAWTLQDAASAAKCGARALRQDRASERGLKLAVMANLSRERVVLARQIVEQFLHHTPTSQQALALKAMVLVREGDLDGAIELLRNVYAAAHELRWVQFEFARALLWKGPDEAREALVVVDDLLRTFPEEVPVLRLKAEAHMKLQEYDQAVEAFRRLASLNESFETVGDFGHALLMKGDLVAAAEQFGRFTRLVPQNAWGHWALADCLRQLDQKPRAVSSYQRAARLDPESSDIFEAMLQALVDLGRHGEAMDEIAERLEGPLRPLALRWKAHLLEKLDPAAAIAALEEATVGRPTDASVDRAPLLVELAALRQQAGKYSLAGDAYRDALAIDADGYTLQTLQAYASYQCDIGRFEAGLEVLDRALEIDTRHPENWGLVGWCQQHLGNREDALKAFQKAFEFSNEHPFYEKGLANALFQAGRVADGEVHFRSVLKKQKYETAESGNEVLRQDSNALGLIGWCNYRLRRFDEAIRLFQTALTDASRDYTGLWFDLALVLLASGRRELGVKGYERACQIADREEVDRRRGVYHVALFDLVDAKRHDFIGRESDAVIAEVGRRFVATGVDVTTVKWLPAQAMAGFKADSSQITEPEQA